MATFEPKNFASPNSAIATSTAAAAATTNTATSTASDKPFSYLAPVPSGAGRSTAPYVAAGLLPNPLAHDANNIVVNGDEDSTLTLSNAFQSNILDSYDVFTYHWKFFMVDNSAASTGQIFNTASQTIIAESGVSDLTIDKVEIQSITTPSIESGTGTSTLVKFEIVEPSGAGLIDKIFYQSLALGIGNWNVMPFYLQLQFRDRTPAESDADTGGGSLGGLRWLYPIKLTEIKANVTTVGTRYEFNAIIYNEYAQSNVNFTLQHNIVLSDVSTFPDAISKLETQLNDDQFYRCIDNNGIPDSYKIIVDPVFYDPKYNVTPVTTNENTQRNSSFVTFEGKNATFPAGTAVDKIIDSLLAQTSGMQTHVIGSDVAGAEGKSMETELSQMKQFWRIITETRPLKFDVRRNDYAREFTVYVISYNIGILDQNTFQDSAPPITNNAERKRLMTYIKKAILKKKYNYIFTGLNDQIINFDIKINNAFAVALSRMGGIYSNAAMADKGMVWQDNASDEAKVTSAIQKVISFQNNGTADTPEGKTAMQEAQDAINASNESQADKEDIIYKLSLSKQQRLNFNTAQQTVSPSTDNSFNLAQSNALSKAQQTAKFNATPRSEKISQTNLNFISDVDPASDAAKQAYNNYVQSIKGKAKPVARVDSMHSRQIGLGVDSNSDSGLQKLSSMFAVALHSSYDVSFATTTLTIKGDPFWLFPQPYTDAGASARIYNSLKDPADAIDYIKNAHFKVTDSVNIFGSDNFLIIRFRTPRLFNIDNNPESNNANTDVETFSGVFKVLTIKSTFDSGKFHQELKCILDYNINILNFMDEIEGNAKKQDTPTQPEALTQVQQFPTTAVSSGKRIMGSADNVPPVSTAVIASVGGTSTSNIPVSTQNILSGLPDNYTA